MYLRAELLPPPSQVNRIEVASAITLLADPIPEPPQTVAGELGGVARDAYLHPSDSYRSINSAILSNRALRSGCFPPGISLRICRRRIPAASSQAAIASRPTGVPIAARRSASSRGDRSVNTICSSSGSPAVRTCKQAFRFSASIDSGSIFFFDPHLDGALGRPPDHPAIGRVP